MSSKSENGAAPDIHAIADDLSKLKSDFEKLLTHLKEDGTRKARRAARETLDGLEENASELYDRVSAQGRRTARMLEERVEDQPVTSLLMAFGAGYIAARILRR